MYERRVWYITTYYNGFRFLLFLETTEDHIQQYMDSELPNWNYRYHAASEEDIKNAKKLSIPIYMYK